MQLTFNAPSIYSQIYLADASLAVQFAHTSQEEPEHIEQGFCIRQNSVAVSTTTDDDYFITVSHEPVPEEVLNQAIFAVKLPCQFDSGLVFIDGMMSYLDPEVFEQAKQSKAQSIFQQLADDEVAYLFPATGVSAVTFIELPELKLFIYFEEGPSPEPKVIVPHTRFTRRSSFLLTAKDATM